MFFVFLVYAQRNDNSGDTCFDVGIEYYENNDYENALLYFEKALNIYRNENGENHPTVASSYNNIGVVYEALTEYEKALFYYQKALLIKRIICGEEHKEVAKMYYLMASVFRKMEQYHKAIEYETKSLEILKKLFGENHIYIANSYKTIGSDFFYLDEYEQSLKYLFQALEIALNEYGKYNNYILNLYTLICFNLYEQKNNHLAKYQLEILKIKKNMKAEDFSNSIDPYDYIASILINQEKYEQALGYYMSLLEMRKIVFGEMHISVRESYHCIGKLLYSQKKYEQALIYFQKALEITIYLNGEKHIDTAVAYSNVGNIYAVLMKYDKALECYNNALEINKVFYGNNHSSIADLYKNIGKLFEDQVLIDEAIDCYEKVLQIQRELFGDDNILLAAAYNKIGALYSEKGDNDNALFYSMYALNLRIENYGEMHNEVLDSLNTIGSILVSKEMYEQAFDFFSRELSIMKKIYGENDSRLAIAYCNLGAVLYHQRKYEEAYIYYKNALAFDETGAETGILTYINIGNILDEVGNYNQSLIYYSKAMKIMVNSDYKNNIYMSNLYYNMGLAYLNQESYNYAYDCFYNYLDYSQQSQRYFDVLRCIKFILSKEIKDNTLIETALKIGVDKAEKARLDMASMKTDVMKNSLPLYYFGVQFEIMRNNEEKAFEYSESLRNRGFLDQLGTETALNLDGITEIEKEQLHNLIDRISIARKEIERQTKLENSYNERLFKKAGEELAVAEKELAALDEEIGKRLPVYEQLRNPKPVSADVAQQWCGNNRTILEYIMPYKDSDSELETNAYCLVITNKEIKSIPLDSDYDYKTAIIELRNAIVEKQQSFLSGKTTSFQKYRNVLYEKLFMPIKEYIPDDTEKLVIIPDGDLSALPFDVLGNDLRNFLGENYAISYSPSISVSVLRDCNNTKEFCMLGIGNAIYSKFDSIANNRGTVKIENLNENNSYNSVAEYYKKNVSTWGNIKGTGQELHNIKELIFQKEKVDIFEQENATEQKIKYLSQSGTLSEYSQILIACHGYFNAEKPEMSTLVFSEVSDSSGTSVEDGYLTTDEIALLKMNAEFLNLSACQTGLSYDKQGDGMTGLTRSCIIAGAENVGVTLWEVNDEAACKFQEYLYGFIKEGISYPDAYKNAKNKMRSSDDWSEPVYWAGFVLYE